MKIVLLSVLLVFPFFGKTQSVYSNVIGATGGNFADANMSVSWTLGEVSIHYLVGSSYIMAEGFQQAVSAQNENLKMMNTLGGVDFANKDVSLVHEKASGLTLYPNPVVHDLSIDINADDTDYISSIVVVNTAGVILEARTLALYKERSYSFLMDGYPAGIYVIRIIKMSGDVEVMKIVKM